MTQRYAVILDHRTGQYVSQHDAPTLFGNEAKARLYMSDQGWYEGPQAWTIEHVEVRKARK